jgi:AbrB family looped-hinge helix DNA binding protein
METIVSVDKAGRVVLPKDVRERLGLIGKGVLAMEVKGSEVVLKRSKTESSPSKAIAGMSLPAGPWSRIEKEIEDGSGH